MIISTASYISWNLTNSLITNFHTFSTPFCIEENDNWLLRRDIGDMHVLFLSKF